MDVTESQLTTALQEAFTCYLAFLSYNQKLRESKLPRQGKGVETISDLSTNRYYDSRVAGIEVCLQYTGKIARRVRNWVNYPPEEAYDEGITVEPEGENFEALPDEEEEPYLDFFSGCLVHPVTPFSAGPSNSNDEASAKESDGRAHCLTDRRSKPHAIEADEDDNEEEITEFRGRRPAVHAQSRAGLGLHPNTPISVKHVSAEQVSSTPTSTSPSIGRKAPNSSNSANEIDHESSEEESEADEESSEPSDDEAEGSSSDESPVEESDEKDIRSDEKSPTFYLQQRRDEQNAEYASRIHTAETREAQDADRELAQARRLAEMWAREDEARVIRQKKYAEDLERQEKERLERIKRDKEAALKAQKEQEEWELAAIARETEAMRAEERKRREEAEAKRAAEEERRSRIQRERQWAEEIKQRNTEETRKRAEEAQRRQREAEEAQRRQREEDTRRRQRDREKREKTIKLDCLACMETGYRKDMVVLACRHAYCGDCIKGAFKSAYKSHTPFRCCGIPISTKLEPIPAYLSSSFTHKYNTMLLELSTPHPKYCSLPTCSRFLPPTLYHLPSITCPKCKTRTCSLCTKGEHAGVCKQDKDGIRVEKLAKRKGWKKCPSCSQVVERTEGCLHITCRCGAEWCYACLRDWVDCESSCGREAFDRAGFDRGEGGANGAARAIPLVATAVLMAMFHER